MRTIGKKKEILAADSIKVNFGSLCAIDQVSINVNELEIVGIIGPNGAGKSTLFNVLSGLYRPSEGRVRFLDRDVTQLKPYERARQGVGRTFQNIRLFKDLSASQNLQYSLRSSNENGTSACRNSLLASNSKVSQEHCLKLLAIFGLENLGAQCASSLSYGQQKRLEIARALVNRPKILLLDEPAAGMNPQETMELAKVITLINQEFGISILLIEHNVKMVKEICDRMYVLNYGKLLSCGKPSEVFKQSEVINAYLGI